MKILWKQEKMLFTGIFSITHKVFKKVFISWAKKGFYLMGDKSNCLGKGNTLLMLKPFENSRICYSLQIKVYKIHSIGKIFLAKGEL